MGTTVESISHFEDTPSCFGTGLTETDRPQRAAVCDACAHARPCLIRIALAAVRASAQPDGIDRFLPMHVRSRQRG